MTPTLTAVQSSTWTDTVATAEATAAALSWNANDRILVIGITENNPVTIATPTATGLTFTAIGSALTGGSNAWIHAWQATAAGSGSQVVSANAGEATSGMRGITAFAWGNCNGFTRTNSTVGAASNTLSVTRGQANSCIVHAGADWNAVGATSPGWSPAGFTQVQAVAHVNVSAFEAYWSTGQGAAGTTAYGPAGLTGTRKWVQIAIEVLDLPATPQQKQPFVFPSWATHRAANF